MDPTPKKPTMAAVQQPPAAKQQIKLTLKSTTTVKPTANKTVLEKLGMTNEDIDVSSKKRKSEQAGPEKTEIKKERKEKTDKKRKSAADRREELLKQLKAVENAIAKKRTRMDD